MAHYDPWSVAIVLGFLLLLFGCLLALAVWTIDGWRLRRTRARLQRFLEAQQARVREANARRARVRAALADRVESPDAEV